MNDLSVSIIVPTFNRRERLRRLLTSLESAAKGGAAFEVVVAVDGATDGTGEMLAALEPSYSLRVLHQGNAGPAAARNRALSAVVGEVLLFLDDDVIPIEGLVERHLAIHRRDPSAVVIGPMVPPRGIELAPWVLWEASRLQRQYNAMAAGAWEPTARQFYTGNASLRREHALAVGGFDETFKRAEDVEFAFRLADRGLRFHFVSGAAVWHDPGRSFESWVRVPYEYGRYDVIMARERGRPWLLDVAYREWSRRHPLNRLLPRWCVGHPRRQRFVRTTLGLVVSRMHSGPRVWQRVQVALCSPLFSIQYWQGIADATGLGAQVWQTRGADSTDTPAVPASRCST